MAREMLGTIERPGSLAGFARVSRVHPGSIGNSGPGREALSRLSGSIGTLRPVVIRIGGGGVHRPKAPTTPGPGLFQAPPQQLLAGLGVGKAHIRLGAALGSEDGKVGMD